MINKNITIVIVSHNSRAKLPECLESIKYQNYPDSRVKVVVIDNNSTDSSVGFIKEKYPNIKVVENMRNAGFAEGNNQGYYLAQKNKSDYLFLVNDDVVLEPNVLKRLVATAESDKKIGAVQAKLLLYPQKELINSFGNSLHFLGFGFCNKYKEKDNQGITNPFEVAYPSGAAVLIKMSAIGKTGLFDDRFFMYHEDVDLGWRLWLAGYKIMLEPRATVYHKYNYSKASYKFYYMERNRWIVLLSNYHVFTLLILLPALLLMELGQLLFALKNKWLKQKLKSYFWLIAHLPYILSRRLDVQFKIRKVKDKEILRLMVGRILFQEVKYKLLTYVINPLMLLYFWFAKIIVFW